MTGLINGKQIGKPIVPCPSPLGPIPEWVRERWKGDKPYPERSLAEKNAQAGEEATNRRAFGECRPPAETEGDRLARDLADDHYDDMRDGEEDALPA